MKMPFDDVIKISLFGLDISIKKTPKCPLCKRTEKKFDYLWLNISGMPLCPDCFVKKIEKEKR